MIANEIAPNANVRLKRIQKVSRFLKVLFFVVTILCIVGGVGLCFAYSNFHGVQKIKFVLDVGFEFTCALLWSFCYKLFDLYSKGELFTAKIVHRIRGVSYAYFLMALVGFISRIVSVHSATIDLEAVKQILSGNGVSFFISLIPGFLILFIAWVMDEGRKIQEEQELTV